MGKIKVVLNGNGVRELLKSEEVQRACEEQAQTVCKRAGEGFSTNSMKGKNRVIAQVKTDSKIAFYKCLHNNTLLKALR